MKRILKAVGHRLVIERHRADANAFDLFRKDCSEDEMILLEFRNIFVIGGIIRSRTSVSVEHVY